MIKTDPGWIPPQIQERLVENREIDEIPTSFSNEDGFNIYNTLSNKEKIEVVELCSQCNIYKTTKIYHCQDCNSCIKDQFFHSDIFQICITSANLKYFAVLLICQFFMTLYIIYESLDILFKMNDLQSIQQIINILCLAFSIIEFIQSLLMLFQILFWMVSGKLTSLTSLFSNQISFLTRIKLALQNIYFEQKQSYFQPQQELKLDLREAILKDTQVQNIYRSLSLQQMQGDKKNFLQTIVRQYSSLSEKSSTSMKQSNQTLIRRYNLDKQKEPCQQIKLASKLVDILPKQYFLTSSNQEESCSPYNQNQSVLTPVIDNSQSVDKMFQGSSQKFNSSI
ncbi:hypothetical protein ABPG72_018204 [Tetrahymena utriculariae]